MEIKSGPESEFGGEGAAMAAVKACMACTDDLLLESGVLLWNHEDREENVGGTSAFVLPGDSTEELGVGIPVVSALEF